MALGEFDYGATMKEVAAAVAEGDGVTATMGRLLAYGRKTQPKSGLWNKLDKFDFAAGADEIRDGLLDPLRGQSLPPKYTGFYFGLDGLNMRNGKGIEFGCSKGFKSAKRGIDCVYDCDLYLDEVPSRTFEQLYAMDGLEIGGFADHVICIGFQAAALRHAFATGDPKLLLGGARGRAVVCGPHDGDLMLLGVRRPARFETLCKLGPFPSDESVFQAKAEFYRVSPSYGGGWRLEIQEFAESVGRDRVHAWWVGAVVPDGPPVPVKVWNRSEIELDVTQDLTLKMIVNERAAEFFRSTCQGEVQLVEVRMDGVSEPHYLLNIFAADGCLNREHSLISEDKERGRIEGIWMVAINRAMPGARTLFRLSEQPQYIVARDSFRDAWRQSGLTGLSFEPAMAF